MNYSKKHIAAIILGLFIAIIGIILSNTYRPYIYKNQIYDFHLADTIGNWVAIPASTLFFWGIKKGRRKFTKELSTAILAILIYEFTLSTFDWWDVLVTFISAGITYLFYLLYKKLAC